MEIRGSSHLSWSQLHCFEDRKGVFFCFVFSGFPPAAAVLRMTTRGRAVPTVLNGATGEGRGHPGVILGVPLPPTQLAPFIIRLQFHNVSCSETGGGSETLSLTHSATVKTKLLLLGYQTILYILLLLHIMAISTFAV